MTKFITTDGATCLLLQDEQGVWANFVQLDRFDSFGVFETGNPDTIERLRNCVGVAEVTEASA